LGKFGHTSSVCPRLDFLKVGFNRIISINYVIIRAGRCGFIIDNKGFSWRAMRSRRRFALDPPQAQVFEDLFDELFILDERDNPHRARALRAHQWINIIDFLYQARPVLTEFFG
jgi:hypothetical protein